MENQFILQRMGNLTSKRLLDVGSGLGESSVYFALQGAAVTMVDISPRMIEKAKEVGRYHGVEVAGYASIGETLPVPDDSFDIVYIANTIHHVMERDRLFREILRVLKPGGKFYSIDPVAYNPVINAYRRMASEVRTDDESPLGVADVALARKHFKGVETKFFWILALSLFLKYYLVDRVHPNADRYWKRIFLETDRTLGWWLPLRALDRVLTAIPGVKWLAWNVVLIGEKA